MSQSNRKGLIRSALTLGSWAVWFGGLTFYAGVVVPIGSEQLGTTVQGFVTQQVTIRLNVLAAIMLIVWLWDGLRRQRWSRVGVGLWCIQVLLVGALLLLHFKLSTKLDLETRSIASPDGFYNWHRAYLLVTTAQWGIGIAMAIEWLRDLQGRA